VRGDELVLALGRARVALLPARARLGLGGQLFGRRRLGRLGRRALPSPRPPPNAPPKLKKMPPPPPKPSPPKPPPREGPKPERPM
jgi:hypothetical protein